MPSEGRFARNPRGFRAGISGLSQPSPQVNNDRASELLKDLNSGLADQDLVNKYGGVDSLRALLPGVEKLEAQGLPGFVDRVAAGFATDPLGEVDILRKQGFDASADNGNVQIKTPQGTFPADPPGFDIPGDLGDMVGRIPRTLLGGLGGAVGMATGGPPLAAGLAGAGGVLGASLEQGAASLLGSKQGVDPVDLGLEAILAPIGEVAGQLGSGIIKRVAAPFKGALSEGLNKTVTNFADAFDNRFNTNLRGKLPLSAETENRTLQEIEQRVAESGFTRNRFENEVRNPFEKEAVSAFDKIRATLGAGSDEPAGEGLTRMAGEAQTARTQAVDAAYDAVGELVPPNARVLVPATEEAIDRVIKRTGADNEKFQLLEATRQAIGRLQHDVGQVETFKELDQLRRAVGDIMKDKATRNDLKRTGLDAHFGDIYGALAKDAEDFFAQGARLTEDQGVLAGRREAVNEAERAITKVGAQAEQISPSQAIDRLGGINLRGVKPGDMSDKVARRLKGLQTKHTTAGAKPQALDQMADRLSQEFPELGIESVDDLLEAMRRDDRFFGKVAMDVEDVVDDLFAGRQADLDFRDMDQVEFAVSTGDESQLVSLIPKVSDAVERGDLSSVQADGLLAKIDERLISGAGGDATDATGRVASADARAAGLGGELSAKGKRATDLAREDFALSKTSAARQFNDESKVEGIVKSIMSANFQPRQVRRLRQITGEAGTPAGQQAVAGASEVWRQVQIEVLDFLGTEGRKSGRENITDAMSGSLLLSQIKKMGGPPKLKAIFGEELGKTLDEYATFLRNADVAERTLGNTSRSGAANQMFDLARLLITRPAVGLAMWATQGAAGSAVITPGGRKFLTQGVLQSPRAQSFIANIGRAAGQTGATAAQDATRR